MKKVLSALIIAVVIGVQVILPLKVEAAACPNIYKFTATGYNPSPIYGSNTLSWNQLGINRQQTWVVERSDDSGATFYEVQRSTSRSYMTGYVGDNVRFRVYSTTGPTFTCSPDGAAVTFDPSRLYMVSFFP